MIDFLLLLWLEGGEVVVQPAVESECRQFITELGAAGGGTVETSTGRHEIVQADCVAVEHLAERLVRNGQGAAEVSA